MSAETAAPAIVCPMWCGVTREEHLEELRWEFAGGLVHHRSAPDAWAYLSQVLSADGVAEENDQPPVVLIHDGEVTLSDVEEIIRDLQAVVRSARADQEVPQ